MKIAIIGSGISGLSCAYHLDKDNDIVVYEKNNYLGGHTDTHRVDIDGDMVNIDSGFIIFCRELYPNFCEMLDTLNIKSKPTNMSFGVHDQVNRFIYNTTTINSLFCQRSNLFRPKMYRMIFDIIRFYTSAKHLLKSDDNEISVGAYLKKHCYSKVFQEDHLFPMLGALWSTPPQFIRLFPIHYLVKFMHSHGLMNIWRRPHWEVLENGSNGYIKALKKYLQNTEFRVNCGVSNVIRDDQGVLIHSNSHEPERFDAVIFATHADQAKIILQKPSKAESEILESIPFERNDVVMHTDETIMPPIKSAWSSWNVHFERKSQEPQTQHYNLAYWMNSLQTLNIEKNIFVSLNERRKIKPDSIIKTTTYHHPKYSAKSVHARKRLPEINGKNKTFYVGAYWAWGFHEDGARTAIDAVNLLKKQFQQ